MICVLYERQSPRRTDWIVLKLNTEQKLAQDHWKLGQGCTSCCKHRQAAEAGHHGNASKGSSYEHAKTSAAARLPRRLALRALPGCGHPGEPCNSPVSPPTHLDVLAGMMVQAEQQTPHSRYCGVTRS